MKTASATSKDMDDYIAGFPGEVRDVLESMRRTIKQVAPEAEERISYRIPTFALHGNLVHFAAYAKHIGFYPGASAIVKFEKELSGFHTAKGTVQFPLDRPVPLGLVRRIVEFRVRQNLAKADKDG